MERREVVSYVIWEDPPSLEAGLFLAWLLFRPIFPGLCLTHWPTLGAAGSIIDHYVLLK